MKIKNLILLAVILAAMLVLATIAPAQQTVIDTANGWWGPLNSVTAPWCPWPSNDSANLAISTVVPAGSGDTNRSIVFSLWDKGEPNWIEFTKFYGSIPRPQYLNSIRVRVKRIGGTSYTTIYVTFIYNNQRSGTVSKPISDTTWNIFDLPPTGLGIPDTLVADTIMLGFANFGDSAKIYVDYLEFVGTGGYVFDKMGDSISSTSATWIKTYNNPGINKIDEMGFKIPTDAKKHAPQAVVTDNSGNVYVAGYSDGGTSKYDWVVIKYDNFGNQVWLNRYNGLGLKNDKAYALTTDNSGGLYVVGESDGGSITKTDALVIKYNTVTGAKIWEKRVNRAKGKKEIAYAVALSYDKSQVYIAGAADNCSCAKYDMFLFSLSAASGDSLWAATYDSPINKNDYAYALAVDPVTGDVAITGEGDGGVTKRDLITVRYTAFGEFLFASRYNYANKNDHGFAIAFAPTGELYVTGASDGDATKYDYITIKYNQTGIVWAQRYNWIGKKDMAYGLVCDNDGSVYVTGASEGSGTSYDYVTIKYNPSGSKIWENRWDSGIGKKDIARAIALNPAGSLFVTGSSDQGSGRKLDIVTLKINPTTGVIQTVGRYNGTGLKNDIGYSIVATNDVAVVAGTSDGVNKLDLVTIQAPVSGPIPLAVSSPPVFDGWDDEEEQDYEFEEEDMPTETALHANYPNPFNPSTTIYYQLPEDCYVILKIYNALGQEIKTLVNEIQEPGYQEIDWNAGNLASGIYFYRIEATSVSNPEKSFTQTKKMILLR